MVLISKIFIKTFRVVTTWMEIVSNFIEIGWELTEKSAKIIHQG